jgi:glutamyl-tRNA synthetase
MVHGTISFPNKDVEDFVVLRSDATPIYNMAVVSDDIAMHITLVMRGDDHISNTPKQILIYRALGAEQPTFAHLPMIHGTEGKKLSKRHGATAVADYQKDGILPSAMLNFLALLGWSPGEDREVMMRGELIERFGAGGMLKKASVFDTKKLEWMNGQHLTLLPLDDVEAVVTPAIVAAGLATSEELADKREWYRSLLELLRVRARTINDIVRQSVPYFRDEIEYDAEAVAKQWKDRDATAQLLEAVHGELAAAPSWDASTLEERLRALAERLGIGAGKLFQPLRLALTGMLASPGIFEVLLTLGRNRSLQRIERGLQLVTSGNH